MNLTIHCLIQTNNSVFALVVDLGHIPSLLVTSKMAEKRVGQARPKTWRLLLKTSAPLSEASKALLPSAPRSPLQLYLSSADNHGTQGWKEMTEEQRQPVVAAFKEAKRVRGQVLAILRKKAALTTYLDQLDTDLAKVIQPGESKQPEAQIKQEKKPKRVRRSAKAPKPSDPAADLQSKPAEIPISAVDSQSQDVVQEKQVAEAPAKVEKEAAGQVTEKRLGWRTLKAMRRYRKTLLEGLSEGSTVTSEEVLKAWKALSYSEKQPFFARKSV